MEINDSLHIFKDSISREILKLTIMSKSWIAVGKETVSNNWEYNRKKKTEENCCATLEFFISLVELDEFNKIKLSKIGRLDQGLNPGLLHNSQAC